MTVAEQTKGPSIDDQLMNAVSEMTVDQKRVFLSEIERLKAEFKK